jgi:hypothetical protein
MKTISTMTYCLFLFNITLKIIKDNRDYVQIAV